MEYIYFLVSIFGWIFFFFRRRMVDFLTIGFASQQIYFSPCILQVFGIHPDLAAAPLHSGVPATGAFLVVLFLLFSINLKRPRAASRAESTLSGYSYHPDVATCLAIAAFVVSLLQAGTVLLTGEKKEVMQAIDRFYIIWTMASLYGFIVSVALQRPKLALVNLGLLLVTVYVGFRSVAAIAAISYFTFMFASARRPISVLLSNPRVTVLSLLVVLFFFVYKGIYGAIKFGYYDVAAERLLSPDFYGSVLLNAEPVGVQRIFSDILEREFMIGMENLGRVVYLFTMFAVDSGVEVRSFNSYFQPVLYGDATYGVGSNVWAHMYSSGGWGLLAIFCVIYVYSLRFGSWLLYSSRPAFTPFIVTLFVYWAFYIHRNDLLYQIGLERRLVLVFLGVFLTSWAIYALKRIGGRSATD